MLGANAGFWLTGGAHRRHDASGSFTPVPYATAFLVFVIDAAIVGCALLAAWRPPGAAPSNKLDGVLPLAYGAASAALVAKSFKLRRAPDGL